MTIKRHNVGKESIEDPAEPEKGDTPAQWLAGASCLYESFGAQMEMQIRVLLRRAEESNDKLAKLLLSWGYDEFAVSEEKKAITLDIAKKWLELQGYYDGEEQAIRLLQEIQPKDGNVAEFVEYAQTCVGTLREAGKNLASAALLHAQKEASGAADWDVCANAWLTLFGNDESNRAKYCQAAGMAARGGNLSDFLRENALP